MSLQIYLASAPSGTRDAEFRAGIKMYFPSKEEFLSSPLFTISSSVERFGTH